jgi:hypothetical protein
LCPRDQWIMDDFAAALSHRPSACGCSSTSRP